MLIAFVAVIVFGQRLPQVAGEAAATVQKLRRALTDLRRDSGIDQEIRNARNEFEHNVVRPFREADVSGTIHREVRSARAELEVAQQAAGAPDPNLSTAADGSAGATAVDSPPSAGPDGSPAGAVPDGSPAGATPPDSDPPASPRPS